MSLKDDGADVPPVPASDASLPFDEEEASTDFTGPGSHTMEDIVKILEEETQLGRLQDMTWVYLVDSGGQPQFHKLLTAFFRNALIGIFVQSFQRGLMITLMSDTLTRKVSSVAQGTVHLLATETSFNTASKQCSHFPIPQMRVPVPG